MQFKKGQIKFEGKICKHILFTIMYVEAILMYCSLNAHFENQQYQLDSILWCFKSPLTYLNSTVKYIEIKMQKISLEQKNASKKNSQQNWVNAIQNLQK